MGKKTSIDSIDENLAGEAKQFFEEHPSRLKEAEQWYKENDYECLSDAFDFASKSGYWQGVLYVAYNRFKYDSYKILHKAIKSGWVPESTETVMVRKALEEGKMIAVKGDESHEIGDANFWHNEDFTAVKTGESEYFFNKTQALCVKYLHENKSASEKTIGAYIDSQADNYRLYHTFRDKKTKSCHPAWGKLIIPAHAKGVFKLSIQENTSRK